MRSLAVKLTLAFLLVGLTGALLVALFVRQRTRNEFDRLILDQNRQMMVNNLTAYYHDHGNWSGVEQVFRPGLNFPPTNADPGRNWEVRQILFTIADQNGKIVFGGNPQNHGKTIQKSELERGFALEVDNELVGYLLFNPRLDRWLPGTPEGDFLFNVNRAIGMSALLAVVLALVLGSVLAYTLTSSLRELTAATETIARGNLGYQVKVRSKDELGILAESFNKMSSELAHANDLRRQVTADIAHDLRTPLSVIMGYTEALSDGKLDPSPEMFQVMHTETLQLSRLIEDLKILALADAGELPLLLQSVTPDILVKRAADSHQIQAGNKGINIQTDIAADLPAINVDVERMAQVLGNLMSNALRYTPEGGQVCLTIEAEAGEVRIKVADTGPGIPPQDLPYIFERAFRGDKARRQVQNGETGLGLAIAKSLVEAHGASITVTSTVGHGTEFVLHFPI